MEGKTHRIGGTVGALAGYIVMKESGILLDQTVVNPALQCVIIYASGIYGGMWSDNDHHWQSSPLQDPASWVQNKLLHIANKPFQLMDARLTAKQKRRNIAYKMLDFLSCRHRSWQTHSEATILALYFLWQFVNSTGVSSYIDRTLWWLLLVGFGFGVISHIFLDCLTSEGSRLAVGVFLKKVVGIPFIDTIRFVPATKTFTTGSDWELAIRKALSIIQYVLLSIVIGYLFNIDVLGYYEYVFSLFKLPK